MNKIILIVMALILIGCGKSDDELRTMIQQEIVKTTTRSYITNAQVIGPYTPAIKVGEFLFISGQIGLQPETGNLAGDDIESQTRQALDNMMSLLKKANYDSSEVVQCTVYLKAINDFPKMNLIYGGYFAEGKYPTRATIEVANLPRNAKVEIAAVAYKSR